MNPKDAYAVWANQYDTNNNKTRDLEAIALREMLADIPFRSVLEIGCGTGKNTDWLVSKADEVTATDITEEMLAKAKEKVDSPKVKFRKADIREVWDFGKERYDLVSFSLVLEHIENLEHIFKEVFNALKPGGWVYIGELHPFKQYSGTKARFDTEEGRQIVECYNHHISEFVQAGKRHGLQLTELNEYFDDNDKSAVPRILALVLRKN